MIAHKTSRARKDAAAIAVASDGRNKAVKVITTGGASDRVTHLLAQKVMLTSVPSQENLGMNRN